MIKHIVFYLILLFSPFLFSQENLVPNGDSTVSFFEKEFILNPTFIYKDSLNMSANKSDSVKFIDKLFSKRNSPHQFILDVELGIRFNYGIGYFYRFHRLGVGTRIGFSTYVDKQTWKYGERLYFLFPELLINYRVYKTINIEAGMGMEWGSFDEFKKVSWYNRFGIQSTLFKHLFLRGGIEMSYSIKSHAQKVFIYPVFGLGITF